MNAKRIIVISLLLATLTACTQAGTAISLITDENLKYGDYYLNVLVIKGESDSYLEIYQHLSSAIHANITVKSIDHSQLKQVKDLNAFDLIYPDYSILREESLNKDNFIKAITSYVAQGGNVFLEHPFYQLFSKNFLGVEEFIPFNIENYEFTYPEITSTYQEIQKIYQDFIATAKKDRLFTDNVFKLEIGAKVSSATSLVNVNGLSVALNNSYELGNVIWFNKIGINRDEYITRLDFQKSNQNQSHFHFGYNSLSWLLRSKLLNVIAINKYGFALEKVMGPYTRPGLSWQNHFEEYNGFKNKDMINFTNLLKKYHQIPSYSLVRGTYKWGKWQSSMAVHLNKNDNETPQFTGYTPNSFYSSGERITYNNGQNIFLGMYPGYKTLASELDLPIRAYCQIADLNSDNKFDLIVGNSQGSIYCLPNVSDNDTPEFDSKIELTVNGYRFNHPYASPTVADLNGDGKLDIVTGDKNGYLTTYFNTGEYRFSRVTRFNYDIGQYLTPILTDWNKDEVLDLIVGNAAGEVYVLAGTITDSVISFTEPEIILTTNLKWVAPCVYDWNADGQPDILLGSYKGQVAIFLNKDNGLSYIGVIEGHNYTMHGNKNIRFGHNSVPCIVDWNNDGADDLIIGGLEYGAPYAIDDPNLPIRDDVLKNINHTLKNYIPIDLHIYEHAYKSNEEELEEYELHFKALQDLGIDTKVIGINHHTWTTNVNTLQNIRNQLEFGAFYNSGFRPHKSEGSPRDSISFAPTIVPFHFITGEERNPFIYWCPAPSVQPKYVQAMIGFDLPLTFFEHVECRLNRGTKSYNTLIDTIEQVENYYSEGDYNFMTERQIAKSLINMYYTDLAVEITDKTINLNPLTNNVPEIAGEYLNTLGLKFIAGPNLKNKLKSNALIQTKDPVTGAFYIGLQSDTQISWNGEKLTGNLPITILKCNVPVEVVATNESIILHLKSAGMHQLTIKGDILEIEGENLTVFNKDDNIYVITHYGDACEIAVKSKMIAERLPKRKPVDRRSFYGGS